jgi:hypothetical protein
MAMKVYIRVLACTARQALAAGRLVFKPEAFRSRPSQMPAAGMGVIAARRLRAGDAIAAVMTYTGERNDMDATNLKEAILLSGQASAYTARTCDHI